MDRPKTFKTHLREWFATDKYFPATFAFIAGLFLFWHHTTRDTLKSDADLLVINGVVTDYSFTDTQGGRGVTHEYYIWLDNYRSTFQIPADFLDYFNKIDFEKQIHKGDSLSLTIPKQKASSLNDDERIYLMNIDKQHFNYLNKQRTLENENSGFDLYAGAFFIVIGLVYYFFKKW